jgi:hypothetical protein
MHQNSAVMMSLRYRAVIIKAARFVDNGILDVEGDESWGRLKIHKVPIVRYMSNSTEALPKMMEETQAGNEEVTIPVQVGWLLNPRTIWEREQRGEIKASSVDSIVRGKMVAQRRLDNRVPAEGVRYNVQPYSNLGLDSLCEPCCGYGHIESKCSHHQPKYG